MVTKPLLRLLRNEIDIALFLHRGLDIECRIAEGRLRFLCPICQGFNTATNPKTNLARCFACARNFNPIDIVLAVRGGSFLDAVAFLRPYISDPTFRRRTVHDATLLRA